MIITCPFCGPRSLAEFTYRGDANALRPPIENGSIEDHAAYVYDRANPAGRHFELWNHTGGCRSHVRVERNTLTHEIYACTAVGPFADSLNQASNPDQERAE